MGQEVLVSIICNAYNQADYIEDALNSFLEQKTDFRFEVLVHDDASTDGTDKIIRQYAKKYPDIIKLLIQEKNQYSQGKDIILCFQRNRIQGEYVAFCEGDDYWTDATKLQKQVDILRIHPEIDMCAHGAYLVSEKTKKKIKRIGMQTECIVSADEVIRSGGGVFATNSLMCRARLLQDDYAFWKTLFIDYSLQIAGALKGGIAYYPECMSAYRYAAKGSWTGRMSKNVQARIAFDRRIKDMLSALHTETNGKYKEAIEERMKMVDINTLCLQGKYREVKSKEYRKYYKKLSSDERLIINLHIYAPYLFKLKSLIR